MGQPVLAFSIAYSLATNDAVKQDVKTPHLTLSKCFKEILATFVSSSLELQLDYAGVPLELTGIFGGSGPMLTWAVRVGCKFPACQGESVKYQTCFHMTVADPCI